MRWPIYVLRGDGIVFVFLKNLYCNGSPETRGPLYSYPERDLDYSCNSCSILCLQTNPTVLVCANKKGLMTHSIVLPSADEQFIPVHKFLILTSKNASNVFFRGVPKTNKWKAYFRRRTGRFTRSKRWNWNSAWPP